MLLNDPPLGGMRSINCSSNDNSSSSESIVLAQERHARSEGGRFFAQLWPSFPLAHIGRAGATSPVSEHDGVLGLRARSAAAL